jgi:hypothetical protein
MPVGVALRIRRRSPEIETCWRRRPVKSSRFWIPESTKAIAGGRERVPLEIADQTFCAPTAYGHCCVLEESE